MAIEKEKLTFVNHLKDMAFIKERCRKLGMTDEQMGKLKFGRQTLNGIVIVDDFRLNLVKLGNETIILMLPE